MSILKVLQVLLFSLGAIGIGLAFFWYYRRPSLIAIPIVVTAAASALMLGHTLPFLWLAVSEAEGSAQVVEVDCKQGQKHHIRYQFSVGSTLIDHLGPDGYGNPTCETIKIGDLGLVTFLPNEPTIQLWGWAREYLGERMVALLFVIVCVPIFSYAGVKKRVG